jgi:hypothetical protein
MVKTYGLGPKPVKPIQNLFAQVTQLLSSSPNLVEELNSFLPEYVRPAEAQHEVELPEVVNANEDLDMFKNVRFEADEPCLAQTNPVGEKFDRGHIFNDHDLEDYKLAISYVKNVKVGRYSFVNCPSQIHS